MAGLRRDLPEGVSDIDQDDLDNPQLCAEYAPVFILGGLCRRSLQINKGIGDVYLNCKLSLSKLNFRAIKVNW